MSVTWFAWFFMVKLQINYPYFIEAAENLVGINVINSDNKNITIRGRVSILTNSDNEIRDHLRMEALLKTRSIESVAYYNTR